MTLEVLLRGGARRGTVPRCRAPPRLPWASRPRAAHRVTGYSADDVRVDMREDSAGRNALFVGGDPWVRRRTFWLVFIFHLMRCRRNTQPLTSLGAARGSLSGA